MKRNCYNKLLEWKSSKRRKPLVLKGARQTGKTWLLKEFGKNEYEKTAYFNFEEDSYLKEFFKGRLNPKKIIEHLSLYIKWDILPKKHLIIFDEIQISSEALNSLKYFCEEFNEYHIVAAGSLLGVKLSGNKSFPVGKVNLRDLYPMTFLEFLEAVGESKLKTFISSTAKIKPYPEPIHIQLIELLRYYYFVGGMPEAVKSFSEDRNLTEVRIIQKEIMNSYILDFAKHAPVSDIPKLSMIWESIPAHLSKENKKFIFSAVHKSARSREYENALQWLEDSGLIYKSYLLSKCLHPLSAYADRSVFKVFCLDIGILGALCKITPDIVDFVCEFNNNIYPLEAKAGVNPKSKSLTVYDKKNSPSKIYRTTLLNLVEHGKIINIPLYAISILGN